MIAKYVIGAASCVTMVVGGLMAGELTIRPGELTVYEAMAKIRAARATGDTAKWTVRVEGFNELDRTVVLTEADHDIEIVGTADATFSGGVKLTGWRDEGNGIWSAPAPQNAAGETAFFDQLWFNGRRAPNARIPNEGYLRISSSKQFVARTDAKGKIFGERVTFTNAETKVLADIPTDELRYAQMGVVLKWSFAKRAIGGYDAVANAIATESREEWKVWKPWTAKETLIELTNVRAGFDAPGEWFLDMKAGRVLYRPLPGERLEEMEIVAPRTGLSRLFEVRADVRNRKYSHNVTMRNLRLAFTSATMSGNGPEPIHQHQAARESDGALTLDGTHGYSFLDCEVSHTGNYAFRFNDGCMSNAVVSCTLTDLGAGGVWMGMRNGAGRVPRKVVKPTFPESTAFNLISNCTITCGGRYNPEATGVAITHCSDTKVVHNDIHDFYYTGVSVGWIWGFAGSVAQRNEIAYNRIYDLGKRIMSDMGGVYTLGTSYGTRVHHNEIHDVWSYSYGGWALYCDEGSEGIVMENNLCWNTTDGGFHQHYGTGCIIRNNIFAFNRELGAVRGARPEVQGVPCSFHFVNNIVYVDHGPLVDSRIHAVGGVWANNLWYDVRGKCKARLGGADWDMWTKSGKETGGVFADPKFVDAAKFDFRLKPDSPAFALGFKPFDLTLAGPAKHLTEPATEFRLASFNIKQDDGRETIPGRTWAERLPKIRQIASDYSFDLVGFQEVVREFQLDGLKKSFPEFGFIGSGRDEGQKGEGTFIMCRQSMFELLKDGAFMLGEDPNGWGRKGWDALCPRVCNWGLFRHKATGRKFLFFNTHLDHVGKVAQEKEMELVIARAKAMSEEETLAFLTGDMNVSITAAAIKTAESYFDNAFKVTQMPRKGPDRSWNNWEVEAKRSRRKLIDYIFLSKRPDLVQVKDLAVLDDQYDGFYPSDHFPLVATIDMGFHGVRPH